MCKKTLPIHRFDPLPEAGRAKGLSLMLDAHSDLIAASTVPDDFQARILGKDELSCGISKQVNK